MLRLLRPALLALALFAAPMLAVAQEATPAPACPSAEYPAVGALSITDGAVAWFACSPDEAYRTVIGASDDVVLIEESGPDRPSARSPSMPPTGRSGGADRPRTRPPHRVRSTARGSSSWPPRPGRARARRRGRGDRRGAMARRRRAKPRSRTAPPSRSSGTRSSLGGSSRFRGIDRVTGDELWVSDTPLSDQSGVFVARSPAAVLGEVVVVPTGATVTAIDMRTGATLWQAPQLDHPAAADGVIVGTRGASGPPPLVHGRGARRRLGPRALDGSGSSVLRGSPRRR